MSNDSSTGGPLSPIGPVQPIGSGPVQFVGSGPVTPYGAGTPAPLEDDALDNFFQALVVNLTGLAGQWVRPRFQPNPPALPPVGTNWAAIGVMPDSKADTYPYVGHRGSGNGADMLIQHEELQVLASFYGPNAKANAGVLRDGLMIAQNREILFVNQMSLVSVGTATRAPEMIKNLWLNRWDLPLVIRRGIDRVYPVRNIESLDITLTVETAAGTIVDTITPTAPD
jgi:hypothetical protein